MENENIEEQAHEQFKAALYAVAMEKFASEDEVNAFMDGFEKEAGIGGGIMAALGEGMTWGKPIAGLAAGLAGVAIVKGINSSSSAVSNYQLRNKFEFALAQVMANNKIIKGAKPEKTKEFAETIFRFAPTVAADPNLLASVLANAVLGDSVDPMTIKSLVDLEGRVRENRSPQPLTGIRV